jgi:hypothetical protein
MEKKNDVYIPRYREHQAIGTRDELKGYGRELVLEINAWDREEIQVLKDKLDEIRDILTALTRDHHEVLDYEALGIDMADLPSYNLPDQFGDLYGTLPVWAIDRNGRALVGVGSDRIEQFWARHHNGEIDVMTTVPSEDEKKEAHLTLAHDEEKKESSGAWTDDTYVYTHAEHTYTISRWAPPSTDVPEPEEFIIPGYEAVERSVVRSEAFGEVSVPGSWTGKRVKVVRLDP